MPCGDTPKCASAVRAPDIELLVQSVMARLRVAAIESVSLGRHRQLPPNPLSACRIALDKDGRLRTACRHKLMTAFHKQWHRVVRWRGKMRPPSHVLEMQATSLKNAFIGSEEYRPFRFQW